MKSASRLPTSAEEDQAALWAARLDGSALSASDRIALDAWLAEDPTHRALLSDYCQLSTDLEQQMPLLEGIKDPSVGDQAAHAPAQSQPWLRRPVWVGAVLTAAAAVALAFLWTGRIPTQSANLATAVAQRSELTLADGTRVQLNAQTALAVELGAAERRVRLAGGQAFFAVARDNARPFIVETPAGLVRVTGTQFDVRAESGGQLEVIVTEGQVQVTVGDARGAAPFALGVGDQLTAGPQGVGVTALTAAELDRALAWRQGQIVFAGTPLHEALARFARYHGRTITAAPEVAGLQVGSRYSLDDLPKFFEGLEVSFGVQVTANPDGSVVVSRRPGN
jgi:transmembrane sensor